MIAVVDAGTVKPELAKRLGLIGLAWELGLSAIQRRVLHWQGR